jgi:5-deoxy-glucuronate isomerase
MTLLIKANRQGRDIVRITPESAGWSYVGFSAHRLAPGENMRVEESGREACIVILSGKVTVSGGQHCWSKIGQRASVFDDAAPYAVYLPPRVAATITADQATEIGVATAPAEGKHPPRLIEPSQMKRSVRGKQANTRYVCDILPQAETAENLLVVEVRTPSAHSSSYSPHKHDNDAIPVESFLEETYYHRLNPPQGFAFQCVYTDDRSLDGVARGRGSRRRDGAKRRSPSGCTVRLRVLLSKRDGWPETHLALQERSRARVDHREGPMSAGHDDVCIRGSR